MLVCHRCDVRTCINPDHLFLGTNAENMRDMAIKGRSRNTPTPGESNPKAKLTEGDVRAILVSQKTLKELSDEYRVNQASIRNVIRRFTWAHVEVSNA
jgi:hypothetical protein